MSEEKEPTKQERIDQNFIAMMKMKHPNLDVDKAVSLIDAELEEVRVNMPGAMNISEIKLPLDCHLNKNILLVVIAKYLKED